MTSTLKPQVLAEFARGCEVFIETGTGSGDGIAVAAAHGFASIVSIEANMETWLAASDRFKGAPSVLVLYGDSRRVLPGLLQGIKERICFWLDAHRSAGEPPLPDGVSQCPLLDELHVIARHRRKDHVVMVDDMRYFRGMGLPQWGGLTTGPICEAILAINPMYTLHLADSDFKSDILVATTDD